jgi:hypothetical protein
MPSAMLATCLADPSYGAALSAAGFSTSQTVDYDGKTYTHDDIAALTDEAYQRHRPDFAPVCGGKPRVERKRQKQFKAAVREDVGHQFGISGWTIGFALILGVLGGPMGLVLAVVTVLFEYYLQRDLGLDQAMLAAMGAA